MTAPGRVPLPIQRCPSHIGVVVQGNAALTCGTRGPQVAGRIGVVPRPADLRWRSRSQGRGRERPIPSGCLVRHGDGWDVHGHTTPALGRSRSSNPVREGQRRSRTGTRPRLLGQLLWSPPSGPRVAGTMAERIDRPAQKARHRLRYARVRPERVRFPDGKRGAPLNHASRGRHSRWPRTHRIPEEDLLLAIELRIGTGAGSPQRGAGTLNADIADLLRTRALRVPLLEEVRCEQ